MSESPMVMPIDSHWASSEPAAWLSPVAQAALSIASARQLPTLRLVANRQRVAIPAAYAGFQFRLLVDPCHQTEAAMTAGTDQQRAENFQRFVEVERQMDGGAFE